MRAFGAFRGLSAIRENIIWQESNTAWPYQCSQCFRTFEHGGLRYLGSSMVNRSHNSVATLCPDCKSGRNPNAKPVPKMADRRTSLD